MRIFTNIVKPTHRCNLMCDYCYNEDERGPRMTIQTLERVVSETFGYVREQAGQPLVNFVWHGGEPLLAGREFYEQAMLFQQRFAEGILFTNAIQTNATVVNDLWIDLFLRHRFAVSVSLDGPRFVHDSHRVDRRGRGTFERVGQSIAHMQERGLRPGVCLVITRDTLPHADEIWGLMVGLGVGFNIIPPLYSGGARDGANDRILITPDEYAAFWMRLYDHWFDADDEAYAHCSDFVFKTRAVLSGSPQDCLSMPQCFRSNISVDPLGDVYACASMSGKPAHLYGNLNTSPLHALLLGETARDHQNRRLDPGCAVCQWRGICHGGCASQADSWYGTIHRADNYCKGLKQIYEHISCRLNKAGLTAAMPDEMRGVPSTSRRKIAVERRG